MERRFLTDYHVHTYYSDDSDCPMEEMVRQALILGLDELAFTEHVDYGVKTDLNCDYDAYGAELARLREKYAGRITLRKGIEFGVQTHTIPQFRRDFAQQGFDFVILSNHQVGDREFWNGQFQQGKTQREIHTAYYEAIYEVVCAYKDYSVLGHLDMIKRYDPYGAYPDENVLPLVEKILRQVIADGKGIEINTSCFRYGLPDWTPSRRILQLYRELGGTILTIGSDAHRSPDLADHVVQAQRMLKELGFGAICTFANMQPAYHAL